MGVQVPELKQCVTTLARLFVSSTSLQATCFVSSLGVFISCFREILWNSFHSLAPSIVVLCVVSRRARAHRHRKKKDADNTPLFFSFLNQQIHG